jgi:6-phosphogluconolactonase (cycloisomerase 2 family)
MDDTEVKPTIQVWKVEDGRSTKSMQTIICHLPRHPKAQSGPSSSQIACEDPCGRYVVISDRSDHVASPSLTVR